MRFSTRYGFVAPKSVIQTSDIDRDLRIGIWNVLFPLWLERLPNILSAPGGPEGAYASAFAEELWVQFLKKPVDELPAVRDNFVFEVKKWYGTCDWYRVYDLIEYFAQEHPSVTVRRRFGEAINQVLEEELSGFRLLEGWITPITNPEELREVETALSLEDRFSPVIEHVSKALEKLSDRKVPDYRNSVKESISAVEAACNILTGKKTTLGQALKELKIPDHGSFQAGMSKLYGYTNDAEGIRHALLEKSDINQADARYFLVICSAFVNYVIALSAEV